MADKDLAGAPAEGGALLCLTLLLPVAAEDRVVDWLLAQPGPAVEFSVHPVAARGPLVRLAPGEEHVRGCARRVEVKLIAPHARIQALLPVLRQLLAGTPGGFWLLPVVHFESFEVPGGGMADGEGAGRPGHTEVAR